MLVLPRALCQALYAHVEGIALDNPAGSVTPGSTGNLLR